MIHHIKSDVRTREKVTDTIRTERKRNFFQVKKTRGSCLEKENLVCRFERLTGQGIYTEEKEGVVQ